jgi:hypothetical protein
VQRRKVLDVVMPRHQRSYLTACAMVIGFIGAYCLVEWAALPLLVDNAFAFGQLFDEHPTDREAPAVKAFNDVLAKDRSFRSVIVPIGDGLWVGVREPS